MPTTPPGHRCLPPGSVFATILAGAAIAASSCASPDAPRSEPVRVMTFNLWHGGDAGGQPLEQSVEVIRQAGADIVGLQETHGRARDGERPDHGAQMATVLGWHYVDQGGRTGVLSRWPITGSLGHPAGVSVTLPSGRTLHVFNVHLAHAPYQPYQLLGIPYEDAPFVATSAEAVAAADNARGHQIAEVLVAVRSSLAAGNAVVLTGDFNEPSHLDWTERAAAAGRVPLAVPYPATRAVLDAGLHDAFRTRFPDELQRPGWTWTPITRPDDPTDRHDRIDFVFAGGPHVSVTQAQIVGEAEASSDVVVLPWPSDHRAVVATLMIND